MKHVVCYSGGHSSALVGIEVAKKYGIADLILLNHNINPEVEDADIKRFKDEVAAYIGVPITYANHDEWDTKDQFDVCIDAKAFQAKAGQQLCTNRLKTAPFQKFLAEHFPDKDCIIYYGFDETEKHRIQRRSSILALDGYKSDYPLALWERTIFSTEEIGIKPPLSYSKFKHANCTGCLKAGKQHWYIVYCDRPDIWEKAKYAEEVIGHSIMKGKYLDELEDEFNAMREAGVEGSEKADPRTFFAIARAAVRTYEDEAVDKPCECTF